jgi:hypothetical protein
MAGAAVGDWSKGEMAGMANGGCVAVITDPAPGTAPPGELKVGAGRKPWTVGVSGG